MTVSDGPNDPVAREVWRLSRIVDGLPDRLDDTYMRVDVHDRDHTTLRLQVQNVADDVAQVSKDVADVRSDIRSVVKSTARVNRKLVGAFITLLIAIIASLALVAVTGGA